MSAPAAIVTREVPFVGKTESVTRLLQDLREGRPAAMEALIPMVYEELRRTARRELARRRPGDTLDTTALVHEAYLKLAGTGDPAAGRIRDGGSLPPGWRRSA